MTTENNSTCWCKVADWQLDLIGRPPIETWTRFAEGDCLHTFRDEAGRWHAHLIQLNDQEREMKRWAK